MSILKKLEARYKEGIHPCMLKFLMDYSKDNTLEAVYDGNHIITLNETDCHYLTYYYPRWNRLWKYGYEHLISSFMYLNDDERRILKEYIER